MAGQDSQDFRPGRVQDFGQIGLAWIPDGKGQTLYGRCELGIHAGFVAPGIEAVPAVGGQAHGRQPMQAKTAVIRFGIDAQALITEAGRDANRA